MLIDVPYRQWYRLLTTCNPLILFFFSCFLFLFLSTFHKLFSHDWKWKSEILWGSKMTSWLTVSTVVLAHSVPPAHELQHRVKVSADRLEAVSEGVHPPLCVLVLRLCAIGGLWWGCSGGVLGLLTDHRAVDEQAQQEGSNQGPAGHSEDVFRYTHTHTHTHEVQSLRGEPSRLSGLNFEPNKGDGLRCGGTKSGHYLVFFKYLSFYQSLWLTRGRLCSFTFSQLD